ncbi:hypothetical protein COLO4_07000 [Corchorus olitorius]|uniref:Uncharacterized protein n=1 Tax=Corchorus olitorius TaxID=93759 RepID=A0A1R3KL93_9ROSI|nr:hypothetical protein COLO4_07000 [Corchorus olitorius]
MCMIRKARANRGPMDDDDRRFIMEEAKVWYDEMAANDFVVEQSVPTSIDEEYQITAAFEHFGWAPILSLPNNYCPRLVREFYANMKQRSIIDCFSLSSRVKGEYVEITTENLHQWFGLKRTAIINEEIHLVARFSKPFVFPCLITEVLRQSDVDLTGERLVTVTTTIDDAKMGEFGFIKRNGTWENDHRELYQPTPLVQVPAPPKRAAKKRSAASSSTYDDPDLTARLDTIEDTQTQLLAGQTELLAGQAKLRGYFLHIMQHLGLQPPPP